MMREVCLHGVLAEQFGPVHRLAVDSPAEAVRALLVLHRGFAARLRQGAYRVVRGDCQDGMELAEQDLGLAFGRCTQLHIVPVIQGAGGRGLGKVIIGIALVAFAVAIPMAAGMPLSVAMSTAIAGPVTFGTLASMGVTMALAGVSQMLAPNPKASDYGNREKPDQRASFLFNGPVNASQEGAVIPLIYGRHLVGSVVVAAGLDVYDTDSAGSSNNGGL